MVAALSGDQIEIITAQRAVPNDLSLVPRRREQALTVWKLDRLGRSLPHLIETVNALEARGVSFRSLTEAIDTTTPGGRLIFHIFRALGQFERDLIREQTRAGLDAAAVRGRQGGRKPVVTERRAQARADACRPRLHGSRGCGSHQGRQDRALHRARSNDLGTWRRFVLMPSYPFALS